MIDKRERVQLDVVDKADQLPPGQEPVIEIDEAIAVENEEHQERRG